MRGGAGAEELFVVFFSELGVAWESRLLVRESSGPGVVENWELYYLGWSRRC